MLSRRLPGRRLLGGLRLRIGAIVVLHALLLGALTMAVVETGQRRDDALYLVPTAERVAAIVHALETVPPQARGEVVDALNNDRQDVRLIARLPAQVPSSTMSLEPLQSQLRGYAAVLGTRAFRFEAKGHVAYGWLEAHDGFSTAPIHVAVALHGGGVVEIRRTTVKRMAAFVNHFPMLVLGLLALDVLVVFVLAAQTTVPVERLVHAVRADDPQGLLVRGADELRELGRAFHEMRARLHRLLEERTRMIAAVAHDYRTYLTRLELRSDFIEDDYQREATRADLAEMRVLLDDTLTFAQHGADEGAGRRIGSDDSSARVDLVRELEAVVRLRRESGEAVSLARPSASWLPHRAFACATPVALHRMLANLLDNAVRYGGGQAHVSLVALSHEGEADAGIEGERDAEGWAILIDDCGPGVPDAQLPSLTEPYMRLETSRARDTGGVGLGLSIVEALAHRFGGALTLGNRPEGGLRATLWLKRAR